MGPHGPHPFLWVLTLSPDHDLAELSLWDLASGVVTRGQAYTTQKSDGSDLGEAEIPKQETIGSTPCPRTSLLSWL